MNFYINLMPKNFKYEETDGTKCTIESQGHARLVDLTEGMKGIFGGRSLCRIDGLPEPKENTYYIVTPEVFKALQTTNRKDILTPDPETAKRGAKGRITAYTSFLATA